MRLGIGLGQRQPPKIKDIAFLATCIMQSIIYVII